MARKGAKNVVMGWGGALLVAVAGPLVGCADDNGGTTPPREFLIEPGIFSSFLALISTTSGLVARHAVLPGAMTLESATVECPTDPTAQIEIVRTCELSADGDTSCTQSEDYSACTILAGEIDAPFTVTNGVGLSSTLNFGGTEADPGYVQGNNEIGLTEVRYFDGSIKIQTTTDTLRFWENQNIVASVPSTTTGESPDVTQVGADSAFSVRVDSGAGQVVFNGAVTYDVVSSVGSFKVNATLSDLAVPTASDGCVGAVSGTITLGIPLFGENARATFSGCNDLVLENLEAGAVVKSTDVPEALAAGIFDAAITDVRAIAAIGVNAVPVAEAPYSGALTGGADGEVWCRFLNTDALDAGAAMVAAVSTETNPSRPAGANLPAAECLNFLPATTSPAEADASEARFLVTALLGFTTALTDPGTTLVLGADFGAHPAPTTHPAYDADNAVLVLNTGAEASVTTTPSLQVLEEALATAATAPTQNPFATGQVVQVAPGVFAPVWRCFGEGSNGPSCAGVINDSEFNVTFSRLGMWLSDSRGDALYTRVVED